MERSSFANHLGEAQDIGAALFLIYPDDNLWSAINIAIRNKSQSGFKCRTYGELWR